MVKKKFEEYFGDDQVDVNLSDADLEALMAGSLTKSDDDREGSSFLPGERVEGMVIAVTEGEVLVEIGRKTHGSCRHFACRTGPLTATSISRPSS